MRIGTKLGQTGPKKAICCLKVPFFRSLPGVNGLIYQSFRAYNLYPDARESEIYLPLSNNAILLKTHHALKIRDAGVML